MKKLAIVLAPLMLVGLAVAAPSEAAPVQASPTSRVVPVVPHPEVKKQSKLSVPSQIAVPGETHNVEATLAMPTGAVIAGKSITFHVEGTNPMNGKALNIALGAATTNAQGKATVAWKLPELGQASYTLKAAFAGDEDTAAAAENSTFGVIKVMTKFDVQYTYGAADSHGGPLFGSLFVYVRRTSDNEALPKSFQLTVNGKTNTYTSEGGAFVSILLPTNTTTWNTKLVFDGDAANQSTSAEKTYKH